MFYFLSILGIKTPQKQPGWSKKTSKYFLTHSVVSKSGAGRQEGLQTGMRQVALNMLKNKFKLSAISEMTGLSVEEIKELKNGS